MKSALCRSLVRSPQSESDESIKARHSHFFHFSKSLRESVEAFGVEAHRSETESKLFYHGMPPHGALRSEDGLGSLYIAVPLSTTSSLALCRRDTVEEADGVVLAMKGFVSKYFDCSWISDFHHEAECLFFGGERALTISQCIDCRFGFDHHRILSAQKVLYRVFAVDASDGGNVPVLRDAVKQTVNDLIVHRLERRSMAADSDGDLKDDDDLKDPEQNQVPFLFLLTLCHWASS